MDPIYLTVKELGALNAASLQDTVQESTVRSASALDSIIAQPQQVFFSTEAYPTAEKKLGIVFLKIITLHPFEDGNKRTAVLALAVLAKLNHYRITYTNSELAALTLKIAAADGPDIDYDALYKNLRVHLAPANN